jgi:hypothetical protein
LNDKQIDSTSLAGKIVDLTFLIHNIFETGNMKLIFYIEIEFESFESAVNYYRLEMQPGIGCGLKKVEPLRDNG